MQSTTAPLGQQPGHPNDYINRAFDEAALPNGHPYGPEPVLASAEPAEQLPKPVRADDLLAAHPQLHEPLIEGLLRREETLNIIAPPKAGKSWTAYGISLSVVMGVSWLGRFLCRPGRVLLIDNELHPATLAHRLSVVANAMGLREADYADHLEILSLRGRLLDLNGIMSALSALGPGAFDLIVLDAFYRAVPVGTSENDNSAVAGLYNAIDVVTTRMECAWINIHHSSKGSQAEKSVVDVGAGAGSQSRAADAHLILRRHEEAGAVVLDAAVRSFPPVDPLGLRWTFPVWQPDDLLDPSQLQGRLPKAEERRQTDDKKARDKLLGALVGGPQTVRHLRGVLAAGKSRCDRLLDSLEVEGAVELDETTARGGKQRLYRLKDIAP